MNSPIATASLDNRIEVIEGSSLGGDPREALKGQLTVKLDFEGLRRAMAKRGIKPPDADTARRVRAWVRQMWKRP